MGRRRKAGGGQRFKLGRMKMEVLSGMEVSS